MGLIVRRPGRRPRVRRRRRVCPRRAPRRSQDPPRRVRLRPAPFAREARPLGPVVALARTSRDAQPGRGHPLAAQGAPRTQGPRRQTPAHGAARPACTLARGRRQPVRDRADVPGPCTAPRRRRGGQRVREHLGAAVRASHAARLWRAWACPAPARQRPHGVAQAQGVARSRRGRRGRGATLPLPAHVPPAGVPLPALPIRRPLGVGPFRAPAAAPGPRLRLRPAPLGSRLPPQGAHPRRRSRGRARGRGQARARACVRAVRPRGDVPRLEPRPRRRARPQGGEEGARARGAGGRQLWQARRRGLGREGHARVEELCRRAACVSLFLSSRPSLARGWQESDQQTGHVQARARAR